MTLVVTTSIVILGIVGSAALYAAGGLALMLLDGAREVVKQSGLDLVHLYAAANSALLDVKERESRLELASELGQLQIQRQRLQLMGPELGGDER